MNKNFLTKLFKANDLALITISSLLLVLAYNFKTIDMRLGLYLVDQSSFLKLFLEILVFSSEILTVFFTTSLFLIAFSFNKKLLKSVLIILFFLSSISLYILNKFGIIFDEIMLANSLASIGHTKEVVDYSLVFYLFFGALLPIFFIIKNDLQTSKIKTKIIAALIIIISYGLCYFALPKGSINKVFTSYSPINYFGSIYKYQQRFHSQLKQEQSRIGLNKIYNFDYQKRIDNLNVVLIIGESLRADHLHLNGYNRPTTPSLEKVNNLLTYKAAASFNTTTRSVTSMLSHRTKADFMDIPPEKSIVSVFKNLGFKTYWYSAQSSKEFGNGMLNMMALEASDYFFVDKLQSTLKANQAVYDESLIAPFKKALTSPGNKFIILHSFGSHIRFNERSPESFKIFKPECIGLPSSCKQELVVNSYDNSVLYTDYFISSVINSLKNTNSILFYASDHGAFLGENNVYANGNSDQIDDKAHRVPMFLYMTDSLLKNKDYKQKFAEAKGKINSKNLSHDNLFDSIIDCSGINSQILKRNLSLCK